MVIGTLNGELLIYKNDRKIPQASTKDLGMIACILIGDILNFGKVIMSWQLIVLMKIIIIFAFDITELPHHNQYRRLFKDISYV